MAAGDFTLGIPGSGASDFATLPIPSLLFENCWTNAGLPTRGGIGRVTLSDRTSAGTALMTGPSHDEKAIWPVAAMLTDAQKLQLRALANWQNDQYRTGAGFQLAAGNSSGNGTLVTSASLPNTTPSKGIVKVFRDDGTLDTLPYSSFSGATFTLTGTLPATYSTGNEGYVARVLRLIDEVDYLDPEPSPHPVTLLSAINPSWNAAYEYGYGVYDVFLEFQQDWLDLTGKFVSGGELARTVTFAVLEV